MHAYVLFNLLKSLTCSKSALFHQGDFVSHIWPNCSKKSAIFEIIYLKFRL